jgi:signal transduction histidine kinase
MGLIKEIVSRQNGKIWAESKPENGAVFHLTFPAAR